MTFFANSGTAWPRYESETREAGGDALDAASQLWKIFSILERDRQESNQTITPEMMQNCAYKLDSASSVYRDIALQIGEEYIEGLTLADVELAALHPYRSGPYDEEFMELFRGGRLSGAKLYVELAQRLAALASSVRAFEPRRQRRDLAPQIFRMMQEWERVDQLGRVIAVVNRREPLTKRMNRIAQ